MERMTYEVDGYYAVNGEGCYEDYGGNFAGPAIEKLAELETLAELGRLKLLALGRTVFTRLEDAERACRGRRGEPV